MTHVPLEHVDARASRGQAVQIAAVALATCLIVITIGCRRDTETYSADTVRAAFGRHGYELRAWHAAAEDGAPRAETPLIPRSGEPFAVYIASDEDAEEAWPDFKAQRATDSFDARRANVMAISDGGLQRADRTRIVAALESLPDRGEPVMTAG